MPRTRLRFDRTRRHGERGCGFVVVDASRATVSKRHGEQVLLRTESAFVDAPW